jgi:hypothetical protein
LEEAQLGKESELTEAFGIIRRAGLSAGRINLGGINVRNACASGFWRAFED